VWMTQWRAISARTAALVDAGAFFFKTNDRDDYGVADILIKNAGATVSNIRRFLELYGAQLPDGPRACLQLFLEDCAERFKLDSENSAFGTASSFSGVTAALTSLASFHAEFEYLIADTEAVARSLVVRALIHLQCSIVADDLVRERWGRAFESGEPACESLGACQLLAHGIWAFKASATGQRTDLVLGEPLDITEVRRASQGLVLTEWKRVYAEGDLASKADEAYEQAKRYVEGVVAGFEVASRRYLVIVSKDRLDVPGQRREGEVTYEYRRQRSNIDCSRDRSCACWLNIAVAPSTPSRGARAAVARRA
jgi:hypothetical protein